VSQRLLALVLALALLPSLAQARQVTPPAPPITETGPAPVATPAAEERYADPSGRFTVPVPTGWRAETVDGVVVLTDPTGEITASFVAVDETDPEAAIAEGWQRVDPAFAAEPIDRLEPPPSPGYDRALLLTYDDGTTSGRVVQAAVQVTGETAYVFLFEGSLAAASRRAAQVSIIASGLDVASVENADLSGSRPRAVAPELLAEFEAYVVDTMHRLEVPGAAIAIVQDGRIVYRAGFGVRELGSDEPVTPETLMMIGSTTKSMTTLMMATLVDDRRMEWDTRVVDLLPSFAVADPAITERLTVRDLVCACTGVPRRDLEIIFNGSELSAEAVVASLQGFEFFTSIGEAFQYSNQMVAAGGYVAAIAAGGAPGDLFAGYVRAMEERVFTPIGMSTSTFSFERVEASPNHALPHGLTLEGRPAPIPLAAEEWVLPIAPAGALWSNVDDLARYVVTELGRGVGPDGQRVVSAENLETTWAPQVPITTDVSYGLGWIVETWKGLRVLSHGGNTLGFTSELAFLPESDLGIVVLTNGQATNLFNQAVRSRLLELAFDQPAEFEETVAFAVTETERAREEMAASVGPAVDSEQATPFLGAYANPVLGPLSLEMDGDRLVVDAGEFRTELRPAISPRARPGGYVTIDPPVAGFSVFLRRDGPTPELVVIDPASTDEYVFRPPESPAATPVATPTG
jgi:CubicO group peptidase (beta-lactamase class C family)